MQHEELMDLKETGVKGNFLLPFDLCNTALPDFYTTYPMHWHNEMEIVYVESGEYEEYIDLEYFHVKQGDIVIVNPCTLHSFRQYKDCKARFRTLIFDFSILTGNHSDACAVKYLNPFLEGAYVSPIIISPDMADYDILKHEIMGLIDVFTAKGDFFELKLHAGLYNVFYILFKSFFTYEKHETTLKDATTRNIRIIVDYIDKNYMRQITVEEMAEQVDLSKHYFMRFFKKYMGMTCIEYINDYRLNKAANLLISTNMQITEVSNSIGITNLSYFNRIFKKKYHVTPKEYRFNIDQSDVH